MKQRFIREGDELDPQTIVARGGELTREALRESALRNHAIYRTYGISVLAVRGTTLEELAQRAPLVRFDVVTLIRAGTLLEADLRLEATGRNPLHYDVAFDDLELGVEAIRSCDRLTWPNPYHEG